MNTKDCLCSLELLRDFVAKFVPLPVYMKNLVIDQIETSNCRLWALRESLHMDEASFAAFFDMAVEQYHQYEITGTKVPAEFLQNVSSRFTIPVEWLLCEFPMLPIPRPEPANSQ